MRGKAYLETSAQAFPRITPAYAGKRHRETAQELIFRDHPRICGEKVHLPVMFNVPVGSPPHMRGKERVKHERKIPDGITPAYAGKRQR